MSLFRGFDIGIDMGTSKFNVFVQGQGVVAREPAYIAFHGPVLKSSSVIAVGKEAQEMLGIVSSDSITITSPMRAGVIINAQAAQVLLQKIAQKVGLGWSLKKPSTLVTSLLGSTALERRACEEVAKCLGQSRPIITEEPLAAANALDIDLAEPFANLVLDVGEGASEVIVISSGRKIVGKSIRIGGQAMDQALIEYARRHHNLVISTNAAKQLKESLSFAQKYMVMRGIDVVTHMPKRMVCATELLQRVIDSVVEPLVEMTHNALAELSHQAYAELIENGIYICGGGSRTSGLRERLQTRTGLRVTPMKEPEDAVIRGCGRILQYARYLRT